MNHSALNNNLKAHNTTVTIHNRAITAEDIPNQSKTTSLVISQCTSSSWNHIGRALATLRQLHTLVVTQCNTDDDFYEALSTSVSIVRLHIRIPSSNAEQCAITSDGLMHIAELMQLTELRVGTPPSDSDEPLDATKECYIVIFVNLTKLKTLQLRNPQIQELNVCKEIVTQHMGVSTIHVASY
jgi:hypothetical protein